MNILTQGLEIAYVIAWGIKLQINYVYIQSDCQNWVLFNPFSVMVSNVALGLKDILTNIGQMPTMPPYSTVPKF